MVKKFYAMRRCKPCQGNGSVASGLVCGNCLGEGGVKMDLSTLTPEEMTEQLDKNALKSFQELTEDDKQYYAQQMWDRAVKEGRELLWDVRCVCPAELRSVK